MDKQSYSLQCSFPVSLKLFEFEFDLFSFLEFLEEIVDISQGKGSGNQKNQSLSMKIRFHGLGVLEDTKQLHRKHTSNQSVGTLESNFIGRIESWPRNGLST